MHKGTMRRVKLALMGLAGTALFGTAAFAADLSRPVYKAPPAGVLPAAYDWTGFYVGGHIGYGWAKNTYTDPFVLLNLSDTSANGILGGGQVGFNYQVNQFVFGVEGDMSATGIKGGPTFGATNFNTQTNWTATLAGRAGVAFDRWLVYAKGGAAWRNNDYTTNFYAFPGTTSVNDTKLGWVVGAGVEWAFAPQWSAKLEYNYMDFGTDNVSFVPGRTTGITDQVQMVKLGVNYKFGGAPLVARY
ncbi:MAG: porin family protein [Alphaproteobacteria bacterium]|nr:porin family protein [Alphaproteobacteria bacterium]